MIDKRKLEFWYEHGYNVLFKGRHGTGKTTCVVDFFKTKTENWVYFSASTMDPWVDFVGVPKSVKDENGNEYLDLVRPKIFAEDLVEAIFMDEFNRSNPKVRNAIMELIQFKSINGKKFKNLKVVWAAVNPDDDNDMSYDVEKIDPAQADRFHVTVDVPYKPDITYFVNVYGKQNGEAAVEWWHKQAQNTKNEISPRRLDYAISIFTNGGDVRDALPKSANTSMLLKLLESGSIKRALSNLFKEKDQGKIKEFFNDPDKCSLAKDTVLSYKQNDFKLCFDNLPEEIFMSWCEEKKVQDFLLTNIEEYKEKLELFVSTYPKKGFTKKIKKQMTRSTFGESFAKTPFSPKKTSKNRDEEFIQKNYQLIIKELLKADCTTVNRANIYIDVLEFLHDRANPEELLCCVEILTKILQRTQRQTINGSFPKIFQALEYCYRQFVKLINASDPKRLLKTEYWFNKAIERKKELGI